MPFGLEVFDGLGNLSVSTLNTMRLVQVVTVSATVNQTYNVSLGGVSFSGEAFMYFVSNADSDPNNGLFSPTFSATSSTATITGKGVPGTAYVGVT